MKTIITGGSGLVGQYLKEIFPKGIYLSSKEYNLIKEEEVVKMFENLKPDIIIHLSAIVGGIQENIKRPFEFFEDNVLMNTLVLKYSRIYNVKKFITVLSTCIYPNNLPLSQYPMKEELLHNGLPEETNFGYAYSKRLMGCQIDLYQKMGLNYSYIIPSNLYGIYERGDIDKKHFLGAVLDKIKFAVDNNQDHITLYGDGTPKRQFLYGGDLAHIIKECIDKDIKENFNMAYSINYTIDEIAKQALIATGNEHLKILYDNTKPNGQIRKDVSNEKFNKLFPQFNFTNLEDGIKFVWNKKYINDNIN
jgi:GDP-L-fucose synthase